MSLVNSTLVEVTHLSPNCSPRTHKIDTITIHCVVGQVSAETLGRLFGETSYQASSNYGVDTDGRIGLYVSEANRSWCSSNAENDNRAVTIEVASDTFHPYKVNKAAFDALLDLVTDVCYRNGIEKLVWSNNKDDRINHRNGCNMTCHRDFANKACPGDYLYEREETIAETVNERLKQMKGVAEAPPSKTLYRVQVGAFKVRQNAENLKAELEAKGYTPFIVTYK